MSRTPNWLRWLRDWVFRILRSAPTNSDMTQQDPNTVDRALDRIVSKLILGIDIAEDAEKLLESEDGQELLEELKSEDRYVRVLDDLVAAALPNLLDKDNEQLRQFRAQSAGFLKRHEERWSEGLHIAEVFLRGTEELGSGVNEVERPAAVERNDAKFEALVRNHARACRVAQEVLCLARNGYSAGAFARWRTIHEISVICMFLDANEQELSQRYLLYDNVDSYQSAHAHEDHADRLQCCRPTRAELQQLDAIRERLKAEYGVEFVGDHGWAHEYVNGRPSFFAIQEKVDRKHWFPKYKVASQEIHANAKPLHWNLAAGRQDNLLLVGQSDEGLADVLHPMMLSRNVISAILTKLTTQGKTLLTLTPTISAFLKLLNDTTLI